MQDAIIGVKHSLMVANEVWELTKAVDPCKLVPESVFGVPVRVACYFIYNVPLLLAYIVRTGLLLAKDILDSKYEIATSRASDNSDNFLQTQAIYDNLKSFDSWSTVALETVNKNMITQHTEMRSQLQTRHQEMVNNINEWTTTVGNELGTYTRTVTTTLGGHHDLLNNKLTKIEDAVNKGFAALTKVNSTRTLTDSHEYNNDGQAPTLFEDSSVASGLTMNLAAGDNTTLFVMEDSFQSAEVIPLVLLADVSQVW